MKVFFLISLMIFTVFGFIPGSPQNLGADQNSPSLPDESNWPQNVRGLTIDETGGLGIDKNNQLYWNGEPVVIKKQIRLGDREFILTLAGISLAFWGVIVSTVNLCMTHFKRPTILQ